MRIAIGQIWQESNTFNPQRTTRADFEQFGVLRGAELVSQMAETNELGGFIQSLRLWPERPDIIGLVRLPAWPTGPVTAETFDWLRAELLESLQASLPVDGVLLALHGALVAENEPDVEGNVLEAIRGLVGTRVPVVATLDLHANVTRRMVRAADALVLYHTAPHIDVFDTGRRGAAVLRRVLIDGQHPVTVFQKLPMVVPAERANTEDEASVSHALKLRLRELEADPSILTAGLATVQPWIDIPELGSAVVVVTSGDRGRAEAACRQLSATVWQRRREYLPELLAVAEAMRIAHAATGAGLIVLSDSADATTSGAPGDSTWVLRELLQYEWPRPALVTMVAPEVVAVAWQHGQGARLAVALGGRRDSRFSRPLPVSVTVEQLFQARFVMSGHLATNLAIDMGPSVVLRQNSVWIVVTSRTGPHFAPQLFQAAGLDPFEASVLVAKSPCGFRAAYQERASRILLVRAPGCAPADFWNYDYHHIPRPLWPWDELDLDDTFQERCKLVSPCQ